MENNKAVNSISAVYKDDVYSDFVKNYTALFDKLIKCVWMSEGYAVNIQFSPNRRMGIEVDILINGKPRSLKSFSSGEKSRINIAFEYSTIFFQLFKYIEYYGVENVARASGISRNQIYRIMKLKNFPAIDTLMKVMSSNPNYKDNYFNYKIN
jgi:hypothetical protein